MRILITPDIMEWGIGALTKGMTRHINGRFDVTVVAVHPRDADGPSINIREMIANDGKFDLWHVMYWNTGSQLLTRVPELIDTPAILTHHNHYALEKEKWDHYEKIVAPTRWCEDFLKDKYPGKVVRIPYGIDLDRFSFIDERTDNKKTIGYVGRVIAHKNLHKITEAANKLGYHVLGTGYVDKPDYWQTVDKTNLEFLGGIGRQSMTDAAIKDRLYERMTVFVMYSTGEIETGTLPLFEAMARGVPVMATSQGSARDLIEDGKNGIIFTEENFEEKLKMLMEDRELQDRIRVEGWRTVKLYPEERMSWDNQRLYAEVLSKGQKRLSIIIPTYKRSDKLMDSLVAIEAQNYPYAEAVVCDDGGDVETAQVIKAARKQLRTPIVHVQTSHQNYGLGEARNLGVMESLGEVCVFLDDRLVLQNGALQAIAQSPLKPKVFYHGAKFVKGEKSTKRVFIENFSWCRRIDIAEAGMFPEWLRLYGGMSQEVRNRLASQGWKFEYYDQAGCETDIHTPKNKKRNEVWKAKWLLRKLYGSN